MKDLIQTLYDNPRMLVNFLELFYVHAEAMHFY